MTNSMLPLAAVSLANGRPITTSLSVAEVFEKRHADVLRSIEDLKADCQEDFGQRNFALSSYINEQNKQQPMFTLTKDGFTLLAMGYTGAKAMAFNGGALGRAAPRSGTANPVASASQFLMTEERGGSQAYSRIVL